MTRILVAALTLALASAAHAAIRIDHPWSRPTPPSALTGAGYMTIVNTGPKPDRLLEIASPAAEIVEAHVMSNTGGIMRMHAIEGGLAIPARGKMTLEPNGDHLMFIRLKRPFAPGGHIPVTLTFAHAGKKRIELTVENQHAGP